MIQVYSKEEILDALDCIGVECTVNIIYGNTVPKMKIYKAIIEYFVKDANNNQRIDLKDAEVALKDKFGIGRLICSPNWSQWNEDSETYSVRFDIEYRCMKPQDYSRL